MCAAQQLRGFCEQGVSLNRDQPFPGDRQYTRDTHWICPDWMLALSPSTEAFGGWAERERLVLGTRIRPLPPFGTRTRMLPNLKVRFANTSGKRI